MLRRASLTPARWRESDISRGGARVMQPGMLFPNMLMKGTEFRSTARAGRGGAIARSAKTRRDEGME